MSKDEAIALLKILKVSYPTFYKQLSKEEGYEIIDLWHMMFENEDVRVVTQAVKLLIKTHTYPPTIADVQNKIDLLTKKDDNLSEMEAWALVYKAICNSNYYAEDYFNKLPYEIQQCVGSPKQLREWGQMENDSLHTVIQSNFLRSYKQKIKHKQEMDKIPESTKLMIDEILSQKRLN